MIFRLRYINCENIKKERVSVITCWIRNNCITAYYSAHEPELHQGGYKITKVNCPEGGCYVKEREE